MSTVAVYSYTHSVTYVADNILKSLKDIIRLIGLDPANLVNSWELNMRAVRTWLDSGDLQRVVLEIYHPRTDVLITRFDVDVLYSWSSGDGAFWTDTEQLKYHLRKIRDAGLVPSEAKYELLMATKAGRPDVPGWSSATYRSTNGMVRQSLGSTIEHSGLGASTAYWRRT
jgi:Bacterial HORMA domain 2